MFKITITEEKDVVKTVGKDWEILSEKDGEAKRGYSPAIDKTVSVKCEVYNQVVDKIDLVRVITAVNTPD